jgi:hypothetical protein
VFCSFSYRKGLFRNDFENSRGGEAGGILERQKREMEVLHKNEGLASFYVNIM